ncbi:hypothetical protein E2C01_067040 [Portunus trituberculatus]|uniref:Uncharacterized protein n=1 Tax=Portunus trituberculatus TaxID=210409 RepID=A0A5B7HVI4_PORTR|nr:hypothetical protein [Portunus trituberculatus]
MKQDTKTNYSFITASACAALCVPSSRGIRGSVVTELMYSKAMDLETSAEQQTVYVYLII